MFLVLSVLLLALDASLSFPCNYYKAYTYGYMSEGCKNCNCDVTGSHSLHCNGTTGDCFCKRGHTARKCDKCYEGYWRHSGQLCKECGCSDLGSASRFCSPSGQCTCISGYSGLDCTTCQTGYIQNSTGHCSECDTCSRRVLVSLDESATRQSGIKPISQDYFISRTTAKLRQLQNKSNRMMGEMLERISVYGELKETVSNVRDIVFSSSSRHSKSLPRQADKLLLKSIKFDRRMSDVGLGLDTSLDMKNQYFRDAYFQYDYAKYKLPDKLNDLSVTRVQLRALSKEVKTLDDRYIDSKLDDNRAARDSYRTLFHRTEEAHTQAKGIKKRGRTVVHTINSLTDRVRGLSTTLAEIQYDQIDDSILLETQGSLTHASYVVEKFLGWKVEVVNRVRDVDRQINGTASTVRFQNLSMLVSDVKFLHSSIVDLPGTLILPEPLDPTTCLNTDKLVRSMYTMFTAVLVPQPIRDIDMVKEIISKIDTVTQLQELTVKYQNTEKLSRRIRWRALKTERKTIARLKSSMQVCNHRLKEVAQQNSADKERLTMVERKIELLTSSRNHPNDPNEEKYKQLEEYLNNLTLKKRKFRSLERNINASMDRMQRKIDAVKLKVLAFESVMFEKNEWSRYTLPKEVKEISLGFRSDQKTGTILSVGQLGKEEDLLISITRNTLTLTCYEPVSMPLYTMCPETENSPCYQKLGALTYSEWYDPRATFDPNSFASLHIRIEYGEVTVKAYQKDSLFFSERVPCMVSPESLVLTRRPRKSSGLIETGFTGCITQLQIDRVPRGIRQANSTVGQLTRCEDKARYVSKSVRESECGMSYLSLASETLLQPSYSQSLVFNVVVGSMEDKVTVMSVGQLKVFARRGNVLGTCKGIKIIFRDVYSTTDPFGMTLDVFDNYISLTVSRKDNEPRTRKLPCVIRADRNPFIVGSDNPNIEGCIKKL